MTQSTSYYHSFEEVDLALEKGAIICIGELTNIPQWSQIIADRVIAKLYVIVQGGRSIQLASLAA